MVISIQASADSLSGATMGRDEDSHISRTFQLRDEWRGPCRIEDNDIDVNLGNDSSVFVRAAYCQVFGLEPTREVIESWSTQLKKSPNLVRRVDVVREFCQEAKRSCTLKYSNPWLEQVLHSEKCRKKVHRDLGAVFMFFFQCPGNTNCKMDWANTHVVGMDKPDPIYGYGEKTAGYYRPDNPGFWYRELLDARYAGLQFILPNVYGPDVQSSTGAVQALNQALSKIGSGIQIGLMTDTWAWGKPHWGNLMTPAPDLNQTEDAASQIYQTEWKPFFSGIDRNHWYPR